MNMISKKSTCGVYRWNVFLSVCVFVTNSPLRSAYMQVLLTVFLLLKKHGVHIPAFVSYSLSLWWVSDGSFSQLSFIINAYHTNPFALSNKFVVFFQMLSLPELVKHKTSQTVDTFLDDFINGLLEVEIKDYYKVGQLVDECLSLPSKVVPSFL